MSGTLNTAIKAAYTAGNIIQQFSRNISSLNIKEKSLKNYVTDADEKAESAIIEIIQKAYPHHNILAEESGFIDNNASYTWIIDPLDGTTNFMHKFPHYCVSIALSRKELGRDKIINAVIFDPVRNDLYKAELGRGAFLNERRIRVSQNFKLNTALVAHEFSQDFLIKNSSKISDITKDVMLKVAGLRRSGSAALDLAFVAAGSIDGLWAFDLKKWDMAAGYLLIKEAGGIVCDLNQSQEFWETGNLVAANYKLLNQIIELIS